MGLITEIFETIIMLGIYYGFYHVFLSPDNLIFPNSSRICSKKMFKDLLHKRQFYEELVELINNEGGIWMFLHKTKESDKIRSFTPEQFEYLEEHFAPSTDDYCCIQESHFDILESILKFSSVKDTINTFECDKATLGEFRKILLFWTQGEGLKKELRKTFKNTNSSDLEMKLFGQSSTSD